MSNKMNVEFSLRMSHEEDLRFISHAWLTSNHRNNKYNRLLTDWNQYYAAQTRKIFSIFAAGATSLVAVNPEDLNQIFGFIVHQQHTIHYIYIKTFYRNHGIANALLKETGWSTGMPIEATHSTDYLLRIKSNKYPITLIK